jgi:hypothetical protein
MNLMAVMARLGVVFVCSRHAHLDRPNGSIFLPTFTSSSMNPGLSSLLSRDNHALGA